MHDTTKDLLRRIESWPQEDQDELVEVALEIEARRNGNPSAHARRSPRGQAWSRGDAAAKVCKRCGHCGDIPQSAFPWCMRARYTESAAREFEAGVSYLQEHAPAVVAAFADSIERVVAQLLHHPYSAQQTAKPGVRRKYIRRFRYAIFHTVDAERTSW
jgi:plasmid stabilization system protein ParE